MDAPKKRPHRAVGPAAAAAVALVTPVVASACYDNSLPQIAVPRPDDRHALPTWHPEQAWSERSRESIIYLEGKIVFDTNKATIRPESEKYLKQLLEFVQQHTEVTRLRVEGHTDSRAAEDHNQDLSNRRALAVCDWLVDNGVDYARLIAVGFGESRPLAPNELADGRDDNRRVEFHVAEVRGRPFLGKDPYNGGFAVIVKSKEEREREKEAARLAAIPPAPPQYKATRDEIKPLDVTAARAAMQKKEAPDGGPVLSLPEKK